MNRRDFIKVAVADFGTVLSSGAAINMLNKVCTRNCSYSRGSSAGCL